MNALIIENYPETDLARLEMVARILQEQGFDSTIACLEQAQLNEKEISKLLEQEPDLVLLSGWVGFPLNCLPKNLPLVLDLRQRQIHQTASEKFIEQKLQVFERANFAFCSPADRHYFYAWFVQAGSAPRPKDLLCSIDQGKLLEAGPLAEFLEETMSSNTLAPSSGAAYGASHRRAFCSLGSKTENWQEFKERTLVQSFVLPSDHIHRIGLRLIPTEDFSLVLSNQCGEILLEKSFIGSSSKNIDRLIWLDIPRPKRMQGGETAQLLISRSALAIAETNKQLQANTKSKIIGNSFKVASSLNDGYPLLPATDDGSISIQLYFLAEEFGSYRRGKVLARRALRMVKEGEWARLRYAIWRRGQDAYQRLFSA